MSVRSYWQGAEKPDYTIEWRDRNGDLIDFSSGYTFRVDLYDTTGKSVYNQTSGITGAATSPNVTIVWATNWNASVAAGLYQLRLRATNASLDRDWPPPDTESAQVKIKAALT
jgi:hypothetical protein